MDVPLEKVNRSKSSLRRRLLLWFRRNGRPLPWRGARDPYRVWVSEILLQQTRIRTALPYYERFVRAFPTVKDLASADEDSVMKLWEGLGYYTRARNLHRAARIIVNDFGGRFPTRAEDWQRLPGVGRYTAGAIASIAFGERVPILDGNAKRVLSRLFAIEECIDDARTQNLLWSIAEVLVPQKSSGAFNQALMELGSRICTPRRPQCPECPIERSCEARALGRQEMLPVRRAKKTLPHYDIVAAAIEKNGRFLLGKRPSTDLLGGLWEFPGGKARRKESHQDALVREIKEELGIGIRVGPLVVSIRHAYSHFKITLHIYRCQITRGRPRPLYHTEIRWVSRRQFNRYAIPTADRKVLPLL